ncbi:MAG: galactokinase [Acidobacteriota bacterium]
MSDTTLLRTDFRDRFNADPRVFSAPGRVNLIGEHTDYNEGFVLPMAIDRRTFVAAAPRADGLISCYSNAFESQIDIEITPDMLPANDWGNHIRGVVALLSRERYRLDGASILIASEVPVGAGLGSSAALEVAVAYALLALSGQVIDLLDIAELAQRAEHEFAGTQCGIMDQYIACLGVAGHALLIDCRSLDYRAVPTGDGDPEFLICDTRVRHNLASSEYNTRLSECQTGVALLASRRSGITSLRDVTIEELEESKPLLPERIYRRCRHVISENARTREAAITLEDGNFERFGQLMWKSHASLRDDYEVSCRELDFCIEVASEVNGVYGARMTGGGFGGCTINLVAHEQADEFEQIVAREYRQHWGTEPPIYRCRATGGVTEETDQ